MFKVFYKLVFSVLLLFVFASCSSKTTQAYINPKIKDLNEMNISFNRDKLDCEIIAYEKVPNNFNNKSRGNSGTFEARNIATGERIEGSYSDNNVSSMAFQAGYNSSIRKKYFEQCMGSKGWIKSN
ncbi:hypothetical protein NG782_09490 [Aliarcobacter cryaerophilus]|uniref:hypothetical protein n=1 Tax=Aliarcobacter cryaerophilus TaxID=28198 RepID=UPI003DA24AAF